MHGLVTASHVDHLHPDAGIAVATLPDISGAGAPPLGVAAGLGAALFPSVVADIPVGRLAGREILGEIEVLFEDEVALAVAAELERVFGGWQVAMGDK